MTTFDVESLVAVIAWLGGACFCGVLPIGFAIILFFTARKRGATSSALATARRSPTAAVVKPGTGLVRLEGTVLPHSQPIDGAPEHGVVYLRLRVEQYEMDGESGSGWRGLVDKARGIPFQLDDGSGPAWVNPDGLDKQLLGEPFTPDENQVQATCSLLGIDPGSLRGGLRSFMWELRAGQKLTVVGPVGSSQEGTVMLSKVKGKPFVVSPFLGERVGGAVVSQTKKATTWMYILGIPGVLFLLCGLGGAVISLIRLLGQ